MPEQLVQVDQLPENIRSFWEQKQQELGEGLVKFSYGILMSPKETSMSEKCGVVYLMEQHLCFEDFYKAPHFLLQNRAPEYKKTQLKIPRTSISKAETLQHQEFEKQFLGIERSSGTFQNILNIFRRNPTYLILTETQGATYIFRDLDNPELWIEAIRPVET